MPGARERVDDRDGAERRRRSSPAAPPEMPATPSAQPNVIASIAPSAAPDDTPRVNGVASGLRSSPWKTTPAAASAAPTSAPASVRGSRATNKICASTLSAKGIDRSNARREAESPSSRRAAQARPRSRPSRRTRPGRTRCAVGRAASAHRSGTDPGRSAPRRGGRPPRAGGRRHRRRRAAGCSTGVRTSAVGRRRARALPRAGRASGRRAAAKFRSWVETTIAWPRAACSSRSSAAISSWYARSSAAVGSSSSSSGARRRRLGARDLRERRGDDDALLLAAAERGELPILEVSRAGRGERLARDRDVVRALDLERAEMRVAPHQHDFEHGVVERRGAFPAARPPCGAPRRAAAMSPDVPPVERHAPARRPERSGQHLQQRRLAGAIRAEDADEAASRHVQRDAAQHRRRRRTEFDVSGLQQRGHQRTRREGAPGNRALPRSRG